MLAPAVCSRLSLVGRPAPTIGKVPAPPPRASLSLLQLLEERRTCASALCRDLPAALKPVMRLTTATGNQAAQLNKRVKQVRVFDDPGGRGHELKAKYPTLE